MVAGREDGIISDDSEKYKDLKKQREKKKEVLVRIGSQNLCYYAADLFKLLAGLQKGFLTEIQKDR